MIGDKLFDLAIDPAASLAFFNVNRSAFTAATNNVNGDFTISKTVYGGCVQGQVKAGAIGRANFGDVTARKTFKIVTGALPTLDRGNPDLKPRRSMGLDASAEYNSANGPRRLGFSCSRPGGQRHHLP